MSLISGNPGNSQKQLADWAGITGPGLVGIVDELESRGLVTRDRSPTDRRRNMLVLTEKGSRTMESLFETVTEIEDPIREELGPEEMEHFLATFDRIFEALQRTKD